LPVLAQLIYYIAKCQQWLVDILAFS
jgi:hypothetical protein